MKKNTLSGALYQVMAFALPMSASGIIDTFFSFFSMMMVAQSGQKELAASALAIPTYVTFVTIATTLFFAVGILISHQKEKSDKHALIEIGIIVKSGFLLAVLLALPIGLGFWSIDKVLLLLGQSAELVSLTRPYFHFAAFSIMPQLLIAVIIQFYLGMGKARYPLLITIGASAATCIFSYGFVLGNWGLPKLGLAGIACASLIAQIITLFVLLTLLLCQSSVQSCQIFSSFSRRTWGTCKAIYSLGFPIGVQFGAEIAAITVSVIFLANFGVSALVSSQIVAQYFMPALMLPLGLMQAMSLLVSQAQGGNEPQRIPMYLRAALVLLMAYSGVIAVLFVGYPELLIRVYLNGVPLIDDSTQQLSVLFFAISALIIFVDGIRHILSGTLRGLHDTQTPMRVGVVALWLISLPVAYFIGFIVQGGPVGFRSGFVSGFIVAVLVLWLRVRKTLYLDHSSSVLSGTFSSPEEKAASLEL